MPREHARTMAVRQFLRKRIVSRSDGEFFLTPYGAKLFAEVEARLR